MSKLFKLKEWLTIQESASHLTVLFGEDVTEADILRLALDGHLIISIRFVNQIKVYRGVVVPVGEARRKPMSNKVMQEFEKMASLYNNQPFKYEEPPLVYCGPKINDKEVFETERNPEWVKGVFDLPLISDDKAGIEHRYQLKIEGAKLNMPFLPYVVVEDLDGVRFLISDEMSLGDAWVLSGDSLPDEAQLVVRTKALQELENSINGFSTVSEKPFATTERNTLLKQIGAISLALAEQSKKYKRGEKPNALQIATVVGEIVDALPGANTAGVGASSIRESIRQGIELLSAIQQ